jgi:hypothetical protein
MDGRQIVMAGEDLELYIHNRYDIENEMLLESLDETQGGGDGTVQER